MIGILTNENASRDYSTMLKADEAAMVLIDHQAGLMLYPQDIEAHQLRSNSIGLAKVAKMHDLPVVLCATAKGAQGPIGPILPEITELFPGTEIIHRTHINSWHEPKFKAAVEATGRKQIIIAGIDASFCAGLPAKSMVADGYDVTLVIDASGNTTTQTLISTCVNLSQAGVRVTNWVDVACQLLANWADEEKAKRLTEIYMEHLPGWAMFGIIEEAKKSASAGQGKTA